MKTSIILVMFCLCSSLSAMSGKCEMNMPNDEQYMPMTSQENMNNTYLSIQKGEYDNAYNSFIAGVDKNDKTLGGFIFETIINGLRIFGHLKKFVIKDYGIPSSSIKAIKNIDKADVISVFKAIYYIAHNPDQFATKKSIAECFESIKHSQEPSPVQSSDDRQQESDEDEDDLSPIAQREDVRRTNLDDTSGSKTALGSEMQETIQMHIGSSCIDYTGSHEDKTDSKYEKRKRTSNDVHPEGDVLPPAKKGSISEYMQEDAGQ